MKILTFGEIMLRLKAPGHERFFQSPMLEATFGGGEANVAVSLANYGMDAEFLTVLPNNDIAECCIRELRYFGVDTKKIVRGDGRMGIYYLEGGANQLPSKVVYDRAYSSIALAKPGDIDWDKAFEGVAWFHITGITPAISESAMELSLESVQEAKKRNITVSCDLNYRKNLWKYGKKASEVMREMAKYVDVAIANEEDELPDVTCYARVGESQIVYQITQSEYDTLTDVSYDALRHQKIFTADFDTVTSIDVTLEGENYTFICTPPEDADDTDTEGTWTYQGVEFDIFDFSYALRALAATNFTVETPTGQEEISLTLHLDNEDFSTFTLTLYRYDGESCIACVDGEPIAFVSRDKAVDLIEAVRAVTLGA